MRVDKVQEGRGGHDTGSGEFWSSMALVDNGWEDVCVHFWICT
jgi:hypothetical protein